MDKWRLSQYQALSKEIKNLKEEIARIRDSAYYTPRLIDGMPRARSNEDRIANLTAKIITLDDILVTKLSKLVDFQIEIEEAIDTLESADRLLMRLRYIDGKKWDDIADEMGYSIQRVWQIHSSALKKL